MALKRIIRAGGSVVTFELTSKVLADNPLGDPHVRKLAVWLPASYDQGETHGRGKRLPVLFDLVGYTGSGLSHINWRAFEENVPERAARLVHERKMGPVILVFPDCFTALGWFVLVRRVRAGRRACASRRGTRLPMASRG